MGRGSRAWVRKGLLAIFLSILCPFQVAFATNGMNIIGYGPLGSGIGGADVALLGACSPIASNPANLIQTCNQSFSLGISFLYPRLRLTSRPIKGSRGNNVSAKRQVFPFPFVSTAVKLNQWLGVGIGVFAQGGMGVNFRNLNTVFGVRDEVKSQVRFARVSPTVVVSPTESLSLGLSIRLGYADVGYKFLPSTSIRKGTTLFLGQELRHATSSTFSISLGANYKLNSRFSLGIDFISQSSLDLRGGKLLVNMESLGAGTVRYDGAVDNFTWPAALRMGMAYRASPWLRLSFEVRHIWWRDALGIIKVKGRDPHGQAQGIRDFCAEFPFNWSNQWVFAVGGEAKINRNFMLRLGFNHGNSPIPSRYLSPLFPATVEDHVSVGLRWACPCRKHISLDVSYIHAFKRKDTIRGDASFFGDDVTISHEQDTIGLFFTKSF